MPRLMFDSVLWKLYNSQAEVFVVYGSSACSFELRFGGNFGGN